MVSGNAEGPTSKGPQGAPAQMRPGFVMPERARRRTPRLIQRIIESGRDPHIANGRVSSRPDNWPESEKD